MTLELVPAPRNRLFCCSMRIIVLIGLMMAAGTLLAGTTLYRWVDDQGRVHYSDQPQPQAEEIEVAEPATFSAQEANRASAPNAVRKH